MDGEFLVIINSQSKTFNSQVTVLEALKIAGVDFPSPCCHEYLNSTHHCGLCFVGVKFPNKDWNIFLACAVKICDGMEIDSEYPQAVLCRSMIMNLFLIKHSLNCSTCDKIEDCFLRKFAFKNEFRDVGASILDTPLKKLGDKISINNAQCILCGRCLSFCNDILGEDILGKIKNEQGVDEIATYPGKVCNNNYSMNLVDICPTGAIVSNNLDLSHMIWNLQKTPSISPESSVGINTYVLHDDKHVYRIIPRKNEHINQCWMTDSARELYKILDPQNRVLDVTESGKPADSKMALVHVASKILKNSKPPYLVFSGEMSLEDQFILKRFLDVILVVPYFVKRTVPGDGFLISDDPYPNTAGADMMRLATAANTYSNLEDLYADISNGKCDSIISIYEDLFADLPSDIKPEDTQFANVDVTYIGYRRNRTSQIANIIFPAATIFERPGTFINRNFILQKFFKAVNPPKKTILECWKVLALLMGTYSQVDESEYLNFEQIWKNISDTLPELRGVTFESISLSGLFLKK